MIYALAVVVSVALVCGAWMLAQRAELKHRQWRREFEAAQKPHLELAKLKADIEARLLDLEKRANGAALKSLGSR